MRKGEDGEGERKRGREERAEGGREEERVYLALRGSLVVKEGRTARLSTSLCSALFSPILSACLLFSNINIKEHEN